MKYSIENYKKKLWFLQNQFLLNILKPLNNWKFVGGVIRDSLLDIKTYDIDISTTMLPDEVIKLFPNRTSAIGKRFGTIMIFVKDFQIEITTTRKDINPTGRHTDVEFTTDFYEDSCRRDFTINSLYCTEKYIYDYHNGLQDLEMGTIQFIGDANVRIEEDYLRILRYIRFFIRFSKNSIDNYSNIIKKHIMGLQNVSWERIMDEITKILLHPKYLLGLKMLDDYNIFPSVYGFKILITNMDSFNIDEKIAIVMQNSNKILGKKIKYYISIIKQPLTLENLASLWARNQDEYHSKFLIRYHSNILNNKSYDHLLEKTWLCDFDTSKWIGKDRGIANYIVKLLFLKNQPITIDNIEKEFKYLQNH